MSILAIDENMEQPDVLLSGMLKQFLDSPTEDLAVLVEKFCDEHFTKWGKRIKWDDTHAYIYVNPKHQTSWKNTKPRIAVAYQMTNRTFCYQRFPGQSKENCGWKLKWRCQDTPIITTAHPFNASKIYSIPVEFFKSLSKIGNPELYNEYFQTVSI